MCIIYLTTHPCGHTVEVARDQCVAARLCRPCRPHSITSLREQTLDRPNGAPVQPTACPCTHSPSFSSGYPLDPQGFAEFCVNKALPIESVVAMVPSWIFKPDGRMIGTVTTPWRVTDYIVAYYCCRNPRATREAGKGISVGMVVKRELVRAGAGYGSGEREGERVKREHEEFSDEGLSRVGMFGDEPAVAILQTQQTGELKMKPEGTTVS